MDKDIEAFFTTPATGAFLKEIEQKYGLLPKKDKSIGNKASPYLLTSYVIDETCAVVVTAKENREGYWEFTGAIDNETVITGTVYGGRARAARYIKFIRNGILSRRLKGKVNPQAKKERASVDE